MKPIILASQSPRRKELLKILGLKFKAVASDYQEDMNLQLEPLQLAKVLSKGKAQAAAKKYPNHIIIAADNFIVLGKKLLGKPHTPSQAKKMLRQISGKNLSVITGLTIIDTGKNKIVSKALPTKVYIKKLTNREIYGYVKSKEPLDKSGAFAVQGLGAVIVKKIEGDFFNVIGLPLNLLTEELKKFGIHVL